jgi:hypothetical protein
MGGSFMVFIPKGGFMDLPLIEVEEIEIFLWVFDDIEYFGG